MVAHVTHPARSDHYRIYTPNMKTYEKVPLAALSFLGRVVGKVGTLG
jgi:hypothetical protein